MTRKRPILMGIVGDSAAGKTTITQGLVNILGSERVTHVCTGDYHQYDRKEWMFKMRRAARPCSDQQMDLHAIASFECD